MLKLNLYVEGYNNKKFNYIFPISSYEHVPKNIIEGQYEYYFFNLDLSKLNSELFSLKKGEIEDNLLCGHFQIICSDNKNNYIQGKIDFFPDKINLLILDSHNISYCDVKNCVPIDLCL